MLPMVFAPKPALTIVHLATTSQVFVLLVMLVLLWIV